MRVVYLLAVQNSGSTVLDALLGAAPDARSLGEFAGFHRILDGQPCDCKRVEDWCGPCTAVITALDSAPSGVAWATELDKVMGGGRLRWTVMRTAERQRYAELASAALIAAADATDARVLIDSSKNVARAAALLSLDRHNVKIVHLVRDPRGYLRSRGRRTGRSNRNEHSVALVAHWFVKNLLAATVIRWRAGRGGYLRVRIDDLVARPGAALDRIGTFAGLDLNGVAEQAVKVGVAREHLYEPKRAVDYTTIRLDQSRLTDGPSADAR